VKASEVADEFYAVFPISEILAEEWAVRTNQPEFQQGLPFLLNFYDAHIRYYRHKEK
jgi:hypothetical protein